MISCQENGPADDRRSLELLMATPPFELLDCFYLICEGMRSTFGGSGTAR